MSERGIGLNYPRCPFCHDGVAPAQDKTACDGCMSWHHQECWDTHGACAACASGSALSKLPKLVRERPLGRGRDPRHTARGSCPECGSSIQLTPVGGGCCGWRWIPLGHLEMAIESVGASYAQDRWDALMLAGGIDDPCPAPCLACGEKGEVWRVPGLIALATCPGHGVWLRSEELTLLRAMPSRDGVAYRSLRRLLGPARPWGGTHRPGFGSAPIDESPPKPDPKAS